MADERYTEYDKAAEPERQGKDGPEVEGHKFLRNEDAEADYGEKARAARNENVDDDGEGKTR